MTHDPRRVVVTFHSNSRGPRARRWYGILIVCEFDGELFEHRALSLAHDARRRRPDAVAAAKAYAKALGHPYVSGLWRGPHGYPMTREG